MDKNNIKKIIAKEWLKLISGIVFGFIVVPVIAYIFASQKQKTSSTLGDVYLEIFNMIGSGFDKALMAIGIILIPYFINCLCCIF